MTDAETQRLQGGALNAALANEIVRLIADGAGRGATTSRAFVDHDTVVCLLQDCATRAERTLVAAGKADLVRLQRDALQRALEPQLIEAVQRLTGRTVTAFLSGCSTEGDSQVEVFVLAPQHADS